MSKQVLTEAGAFEKVKELLELRLGLDAGDVTMESSFMDDLGADSLDLIEIAMEIEDEFDMEISDDEMENLTTVRPLIDTILKAKNR